MHESPFTFLTLSEIIGGDLFFHKMWIVTTNGEAQNLVITVTLALLCLPLLHTYVALPVLPCFEPGLGNIELAGCVRPMKSSGLALRRWDSEFSDSMAG